MFCFLVIQCPSIFPPKNGKKFCISQGNFPKEGDKCYFFCKVGFTLIGSITTTCMAYHNVGKWSPAETTVCCELNYLLYVHIIICV